MTALGENPDNDIRVYGIFDDRDDSRSPAVITGVPKLGKTDTLLAFARMAEIDMLIVTLPLSAEKRIETILKMVAVLPIDVRLSNSSADPTFRRRGGHAAGGSLISVMSRPIQSRSLALKRAVDIVGAAGALIVLSPILVTTALAIRLDSSGPILFKQFSNLETLTNEIVQWTCKSNRVVADRGLCRFLRHSRIDATQFKIFRSTCANKLDYRLAMSITRRISVSTAWI